MVGYKNKTKPIIMSALLGLAIVIASLVSVLQADAAPNKVYDYCDLFNRNEEAVLQTLAIEIETKANIDCLVLTDFHREDQSTGEQRAIYFYESKYDKDSDGIIYYLDISDRMVYVSTFGSASKKINTQFKIDLISAGSKEMRKNAYCVALVTMMNLTIDKYDVSTAFIDLSEMRVDNMPGWYVITSLMISTLLTALFVVWICMRYKHIPETSDLEKYSTVHLQLRNTEDIFLRSYVRKHSG